MLGNYLKPGASSCFGLIHVIQAGFKLFASVKTSVVGRGCNKLAHEIAAMARNNGDLKLIADVPADLRELMHSQCNALIE